ncbi:tRNA preQ1(34) S-adenosylmethionine ribosyltransferase-isomerase QueA [Candidatus Falkowbacteria bacterium]|nr:tRNA preQ1(34) S-adenosylmethionine ribosyltransferase-isomerase QueA [Candidatus Falkowbacteria bacterium]
MKYSLKDFDYDLPDSLIATHPAKPRDHSRLLVLDKKTGAIEHKKFFEIIDHLNEGDVLVMNDSKVIPARLFAGKAGTGGKVEVLLHKKLGTDSWQCLLGGRVKEGLQLEFGRGLSAQVEKNNEDGTWDLKFNKKEDSLMEAIIRLGEMPLPPYIVSQRKIKKEKLKNISDKKNYQTVYANDGKAGSVAAPTAGLHFTPKLIDKILAKGIKIEYITLYVGLGTFAPVKEDDISKHKMHAEWVEIAQSTIKNLQSSIRNKKRVIAVGTTSARALEACFSDLPKKGAFKDWVDIFITPGYKFKIVDGLITNFHLPKSTLLMLVSALVGKANIDKAYVEAVKKKYRFYSYGDAMFIS